MKSIITILLCLVVVSFAKSQPGCPSPFAKTDETMKRFQIGIGGGLTALKGDRKSANAMGTAGYFNFDYQFVRGLYAGLRMQLGSLKMSPVNYDYRESDARYFGYGAGVLIHPIELINGADNRRRATSMARNLVKDFYIAVDVLNVSSRFNSVYRDLSDYNSYGPIEGNDADGVPIFKNRVTSLMLPSLNIGLAPVLNSRTQTNSSGKKNVIRLVLNAQFNFANNDELDGYTPYDQNMNRISEENDRYNFYSLGLRYSF
ncbi:hypothetical protein [Sphingobacterium rhinopitheci]|uniref:hypothetical protein n=1 Tax=Sphingobacterium rhinopitheci TaxID=2781960 RepID=UPI001F51A54C|nr:hypothetical protein [Sphingobacterium rhinopitheci]MCI0919828.1 hypothetical protein [Sphingobacterium rhinopitheci]